MIDTHATIVGARLNGVKVGDYRPEIAAKALCCARLWPFASALKVSTLRTTLGAATSSPSPRTQHSRTNAATGEARSLSSMTAAAVDRWLGEATLLSKPIETGECPGEDLCELGTQCSLKCGILPRHERVSTSTTKRPTIASAASPNCGSSLEMIRKRQGSLPFHCGAVLYVDGDRVLARDRQQPFEEVGRACPLRRGRR